MTAQGVNVDLMMSEGVKRIKQIQLKIQAEKTKAEMASMESVKLRAVEWVENLLNKVDSISLSNLIKQEQVLVNFRNVEELNKEDIKDILIKHYTLKFSEEEGGK